MTCILITCIELITVNIHANTTVSSLTASRPNTHVKPNTGSRMIAAFADALSNVCMNTLYVARSKM